MDQHDISQPTSSDTSIHPRKRSRSVLEWFEKKVTHLTASHPNENVRTRERSATETLVVRRPNKSPPISYFSNDRGRLRSPTMDSNGSKNKKIRPPKIIISDTDAKAQQSPSIFHFFLGR